MNTAHLLKLALSTMDKISVSGIDNLDRMLGVANLLKQVIADLESKKEETTDG